MSRPLDRLRHHVSGAIARGESVPVTEQREPPAALPERDANAIRACIFAAETVAHMRGLEAELLPHVEAAREELARLLFERNSARSHARTERALADGAAATLKTRSGQRDAALRDLGNANERARVLAAELVATREELGAARDAVMYAQAALSNVGAAQVDSAAWLAVGSARQSLAKVMK